MAKPDPTLRADLVGDWHAPLHEAYEDASAKVVMMQLESTMPFFHPNFGWKTYPKAMNSLEDIQQVRLGGRRQASWGGARGWGGGCKTGVPSTCVALI